MADEEEAKEETTEEGAEEAPKKSKKGIFLGGGVLGLVATAYIMSMMAVPSEPEPVPFNGPFVIGLSQAAPDLRVNLSGSGGKRYLKCVLQAEYMGYDEVYATARVADPLYQAKEKHSMIGLASTKTKEDLEDLIGKERFAQELREIVNPILFPIHVGNELQAEGGHEDSGLEPGRTVDKSTMRLGFQDHFVHIDGPMGTIQLGKGEPVDFVGAEDQENLAVFDEDGLCLFLDVTGLDPEFVGDVNVGTFGHVKSIFYADFIVQ